MKTKLFILISTIAILLTFSACANANNKSSILEINSSETNESAIASSPEQIPESSVTPEEAVKDYVTIFFEENGDMIKTLDPELLKTNLFPDGFKGCTYLKILKLEDTGEKIPEDGYNNYYDNTVVNADIEYKYNDSNTGFDSDLMSGKTTFYLIRDKRTIDEVQNTDWKVIRFDSSFIYRDSKA